MSSWQKTIYPGVRYRENPSKIFNGKPDKYFAIRYRIDGKLKEEGLGWASQNWNAKKASLELAKLKEAQTLGEGPQTLEEKRLLLKERKTREKEDRERQTKEETTFSTIFLNIYFPNAQSNKHKLSYKREESLFKLWIAPVIGNLPLKEIAPIHLERIKKDMSEAGKSARSIRYALATIRQVFNFSRRNNLFEGDSPTRKVKMPQADNRRHRFLSREEAETLLSALAIKSPQTHEIALMSLHCGMRANEIFSLTWGDIDIDRGLITLRDTKSGRNRAAFMTKTIKEMLSIKIKGENDQLVFPGRGGVKIQSISNSLNRVVDELGFNNGITDPRQKVVFHTLRHTFASWLVEKGVDLYTVKELLGHSTIALTERYSHLGNDTLQKAVNVIDG